MSRVSHAHYPFLARLVDAVLPPLAAFGFVSCAIMLDVAVCFDLLSLSLFPSYNERDDDGIVVGDCGVSVVVSIGESDE